ncbi:unnamed protein product, partial [Ectocarpus fasciculatus]
MASNGRRCMPTSACTAAQVAAHTAMFTHGMQARAILVFYAFFISQSETTRQRRARTNTPSHRHHCSKTLLSSPYIPPAQLLRVLQAQARQKAPARNTAAAAQHVLVATNRQESSPWRSLSEERHDDEHPLCLEGVAALGKVVQLLLLALGLEGDLFRVQLAADGAGLLGAKVEGHVLHVLVVLAE